MNEYSELPINVSSNERMSMDDSLKIAQNFAKNMENRSFKIIFATPEGYQTIHYDAHKKTLSAPFPKEGQLFMLPEVKTPNIINIFDRW